MAKLMDLPPELHVEIVCGIIPDYTAFKQSICVEVEKHRLYIHALASTTNYWRDVCLTVIKKRQLMAEIHHAEAKLFYEKLWASGLPDRRIIPRRRTHIISQGMRSICVSTTRNISKG